MLYPCVPNTTAVIQEMDISFGPFKHLFCKSLNQLTENRLQCNAKISLSPVLISFFVFRGKDKMTGTCNYDDAFAYTFSGWRNKAVWAAVGAAPLSRKCLESQNVWHTTEEAPQYKAYKELQQVNHNACRLLCTIGFKGNLLIVDLKKEVTREEVSVTVPHGKESIEVFATSKTHGNQFFKTRGRHVTHDDAIKGLSLGNQRQIRDVLQKKEKAKCQAAKKVEDTALKILAGQCENPQKKLIGNLRMLLLYYLEWRGRTMGILLVKLEEQSTQQSVIKHIFTHTNPTYETYLEITRYSIPFYYCISSSKRHTCLVAN